MTVPFSASRSVRYPAERRVLDAPEERGRLLLDDWGVVGMPIAQPGITMQRKLQSLLPVFTGEKLRGDNRCVVAPSRRLSVRQLLDLLQGEIGEIGDVSW